MQRKITHYLISVCYKENNQVVPIFYNFCVELQRYPSRREITEYILENIEDSSDVTILGICGQTEIENQLYLEIDGE